MTYNTSIEIGKRLFRGTIIVCHEQALRTGVSRILTGRTYKTKYMFDDEMHNKYLARGEDDELLLITDHPNIPINKVESVNTLINDQALFSIIEESITNIKYI